MSEEAGFTELAQLAAGVAREAGSLLLGYYRGAVPGEAVAASARAKSTRTDLVTEADTASERLIVERLSTQRPEDGILAEEGTRRESRSGLVWVVDPLDGTVNFFYGFPSFAVSIACTAAGRSVAAAVTDPSRDETFVATRGGGAFLAGERLETRVPPALSEALVATGFSYDSGRRREQASTLVGVLPCVRDVRRAGAASLDLCWVAAGRLDAYYEGGLLPWDEAAGTLVVEEAGGRVSHHDGLLDGAETLVAAPPLLHDELVALLRDSSVGSP